MNESRKPSVNAGERIAEQANAEGHRQGQRKNIGTWFDN